MRIRFASTIAVLVLAACNRSPTISATNATAAEVATKIAAAGGTESFVRPGKWSTTVTIDDMSAPDLPPQVQAQMKQHMSMSHATETCMTPEQAKKPTAEMFNGAAANCRYDRFAMGGGKLDMVMRCTAGSEGETGSQQMAVTGTYDSDHYQMAMTSTTESAKGTMGAMSMKMHLTAKRIGDCTAAKTKGN